MPIPKGSQNNIRSKREVTITYGWFNGLFRLKWVDANQRIKMLQIALQYTLPKLKQEVGGGWRLDLYLQALKTVLYIVLIN